MKTEDRKQRSEVRRQKTEIRWRLVWFIALNLLFAVYGLKPALAGNIESPAEVSAVGSRMYTLEQIYDVASGDAATQPDKHSGFEEPAAGPASTMHTLDDIMGKLAAGVTTATSGADILTGKTAIIRGSGTGETLVSGSASAGGAYGLPKTGQEVCYSSTGTVIACASSGNDAEYADPAGGAGKDIGYTRGEGTWVGWNADGGRFTKQGSAPNMTIIDNATGLEWVANPTDAGVGGTYKWYDSTLVTYPAIAACEGLSYADHTDWRLPNVKELQSIVDYGTFSPAIDTNFFTSQSDYYWSSTTYAYNTGYAWFVYFYNGYVCYGGKTAAGYVRPVRGGQ